MAKVRICFYFYANFTKVRVVINYNTKHLKVSNDKPLQEEVKKMCDVCDTTLWHWSKKNYLKPVKVGNKVICSTCGFVCFIVFLFSI